MPRPTGRRCAWRIHDFVALMLSHIKEFTSRYELDGVALDMPVPIDGECFCAECLRQLRARNLDPFDTRGAARPQKRVAQGLYRQGS